MYWNHIYTPMTNRLARYSLHENVGAAARPRPTRHCKNHRLRHKAITCHKAARLHHYEPAVPMFRPGSLSVRCRPPGGACHVPPRGTDAPSAPAHNGPPPVRPARRGRGRGGGGGSSRHRRHQGLVGLSGRARALMTVTIIPSPSIVMVSR